MQRLYDICVLIILALIIFLCAYCYILGVQRGRYEAYREINERRRIRREHSNH